jgi:hypothetical protein
MGWERPTPLILSAAQGGVNFIIETAPNDTPEGQSCRRSSPGPVYLSRCAPSPPVRACAGPRLPLQVQASDPARGRPVPRRRTPPGFDLALAPPVVATITLGSPPTTSNTYSVVTPPTVCAVRLLEPSYSKLLTTPATFALTRRLAASQVYTLVPWVRKLPRQSPK